MILFISMYMSIRLYSTRALIHSARVGEKTTEIIRRHGVWDGRGGRPTHRHGKVAVVVFTAPHRLRVSVTLPPCIAPSPRL